MVGVGSKAPGFELASDTGDVLSMRDFAGKILVLYFYPKDDTPGWTQEASDFRDEIDAFKSKKAAVVGVSKDSVKSHQKFKAKYDIPFPLLADVDKELCEAYGVIKEKMNYGKKYMGVERSTFIIDASGVVTHAYRGVKTKGHIEALLAEL